MTTEPTVEPLRFAYWVPNVSGGLVTSTTEQRTDWPFEYNRDVLPLVRQLEADNGLDPAAVPGPAAGLTEVGPARAGAR